MFIFFLYYALLIIPKFPTVAKHLTHKNLTFFLWDLGKQRRPRSDAAERGVWSGSHCFLKGLFIRIWIEMKNSTKHPWNYK